MLFDTTTEFGARIVQRLRDEEVIWLTTVNSDHKPEPSPVWFLWDGADTILIYSQPDKPKLRNIAENPIVALNFNTTPTGEDVVVLSGEAALDDQAPPPSADAAYLAKYRAAIQRIGYDPEQFAQSYSVPIRVRLTKVRGF